MIEIEFDTSIIGISHALASDLRISHRARGVLIFLMANASKLEYEAMFTDWEKMVELSQALTELQNFGYLKRKAIQDKVSGKFVGWKYVCIDAVNKTVAQEDSQMPWMIGKYADPVFEQRVGNLLQRKGIIEQEKSLEQILPTIRRYIAQSKNNPQNQEELLNEWELLQQQKEQELGTIDRAMAKYDKGADK